jgi:nitroreductase
MNNKKILSIVAVAVICSFALATAQTPKTKMAKPAKMSKMSKMAKAPKMAKTSKMAKIANGVSLGDPVFVLGAQLTMSAFSDLLNGHRSIRSFTDEPIDPELVRRVCEDAVVGASSSGNLNSVTMVLTKDAERKRKLYELHSEQEMILEAPLVITFCADWFRTREWLQMRGARDNFNNFVGYNVAAFDAMIVAQNVCLGFEAEGLGICYMGTTLFSMREIGELLELPDTCVPVTTIVVGHPAEKPAKRDRLPLNEFIHEERYQPKSPHEMEEIYSQREINGWARYMASPELRALAEEHGITSLAHFYTSKVKYDPEFFQKVSQDLRDLLETKHFLP